MTGPAKAAVALACLFGLAACGGGGGGGTAGNGGGPMPMEPEPLVLTQDSAQVATIRDAVTMAPSPTGDGATDWYAGYRSTAGDGIIIGRDFEDPDSPVAYAQVPGQPDTRENLEGEHLDGNAWKFTHNYDSGGTDYVGTLLLFLGPDDYVDRAAGDYSYWGVWIRKTTATDGTVTWDRARSFSQFDGVNSGRGQTYELSQLQGLTGTATYSGEAGGLYTRGDAAGWFRADTSLEVKFGGSGIEDAEKFTATGTIDNFELSGGEETDWTVALTGAYTKNSSNQPTTLTWNGTANGSGAAGNVYQGIVYGETLTELPTVMIGQFKAFS